MAKAETGKVASQPAVGVQAVSVATVSKVPFFEMARSLGISPQTENLLVEKYQIPTESLQGSLLWGGYFLRALNGDRSPEIIEWQKSNKARPKISLFRTEQMPEENAVLGPLMRGMLEAAGDLFALGVKGATFPHRELIRFICGEETITEEISKKVANFIELEAGRIHMGQTPETLQKGKDFINYVGEGKFVLALEQKANEFELLPREEKLQIIGSELFNWVLLPGVVGAAGKVSTSAARIVVAAEKGGIKAASGVAQGGSAAATGVSAFSETAITRQVAQLEKLGETLPVMEKGGRDIKSVAITPNYALRSQSLVTPSGRVRAVFVGEYNFFKSSFVNISEDAAKSFMGGYKSYILQEDISLWRVGSDGMPFGRYFTFTKPASEFQSRMDSAIVPIWSEGHTSIVDTAFHIKIPKGTLIHVGLTAPPRGHIAEFGFKRDFFLGGTQQVYIENLRGIKGVGGLKSCGLKSCVNCDHKFFVGCLG